MYVNTVKESEYAPSAVAGHNKWYVRVFPEAKDGIITCVEERINHEPKQEDFEKLAADWLSKNKKWKVREAIEYANSDAVRSFGIGNVRDWLNDNNRQSIRQAAQDKADEGREVFNLTFGGVNIPLQPLRVVEIMKSVEVYASDCHDNTEAHKSAINALTDWREVEDYDYTTNYPEQPQFEA